ncbi:helix-turn-helix domain-containing protein, partial [Mycobacterium tuberculosis]|nr:helix-turn-helix domain-containing protein [Mycobacterium tuberculosis]
QKQLRLQEARRLILSQSLDAATAGHAVGYDSPSQFSREYARLFGQPPLVGGQGEVGGEQRHAALADHFAQVQLGQCIGIGQRLQA